MTVTPDGAPRTQELAQRLRLVRDRIEAARAHSHRPDPVHLVVVTKYFPVQDVAILAGLGVTDVGENKVQEATTKFLHLPRPAVRRHFVGQVQTNKARQVAAWADVVQSVDRPKLVTALDRAAQAADRRLEVLIQVNVDQAAGASPSTGRGGADPAAIGDLAALIADAEALELRGVMAVAPLGADPRAAFDRLARVAGAVRANHPAATWISAGMSGDLEEAIAAGATHLRVGTAILGSRPSHR